MNHNFTRTITIHVNDYCRLSADDRQMTEDGPMVKTKVNGQETFVSANVLYD